MLMFSKLKIVILGMLNTCTDTLLWGLHNAVHHYVSFIAMEHLLFIKKCFRREGGREKYFSLREKINRLASSV